MRVITGSARGRNLISCEGRDVRPTTDMVKEAMFSIIQFDIEGACVLDLFCGSGQLGIEALSRGADICSFVDSSNKSVKVATENIESCNFTDNSKIYCIDSYSFLENCQKGFDLVFLDPPYNKGTLEKIMPKIAEVTSDEATVVCEHEKGLVLLDSYGNLSKKKTYRYGSIEITIFKSKTGE